MTETGPATPDVLHLLACFHEAGHALAAVLVDGGELISSVVRETATSRGETIAKLPHLGHSLYYFAGPWAEARARWLKETLDGTDEEGKSFRSYLDYEWFSNSGAAHGDHDLYLKWLQYDWDHFAVGDIEVRESDWWDLLNSMKGAIEDVALMHLNGKEITHDKVQAAIDRARAAQPEQE